MILELSYIQCEAEEENENMLDKKIIKVAIGIPTKGMTDATAYDNDLELLAHIGMLELASKLGVHELDGQTFDYPNNVYFKFFLVTIPRVFPALAREEIANKAMSENADYIFFFDDDMVMPPDLFERLYKHQKDIVAALAFTRLFPFSPVIYNVLEGYDGTEKKEYYTTQTVMRYPKDTLVECDAVGFGAVLIDTKTIKSMKKPWFMTTSGAGEDIHFCTSARKAGFHIFMDTASKIGHLGERPIINEETYESHHPEIFEQRKQMGDEKKYA